MEINGIPLHPLVVHAVVVFGPLAALLGVVHAFVPRWRWATRWPLVALTLLATGAAVVAAASGQNLLESRAGLEDLPGVADHRSAGTLARNAMLAYTVVMGLAVARLGGPSALASGRGGKDQRGGPVDLVASVALALAGLGAIVALVLAGDSGAHAVWGS